MFALDTKKEPKLHANVAALLTDAHKDFTQTFDKQRNKHKKLRSEVESRALAGDVDALKQYRQLIRVEQTWKMIKSRMLQDLERLTEIAAER